MKICMVITCDLVEDGGVKSHIVYLAEALRRIGDEVWIIGPSRGGDLGPFVQGFRGIVDIYHNGSGNRIGILTRPWEVKRFLDEHAFDLVHVHEPGVPFFPYWALLFSPGAAHVCTFHAYSEESSLAVDTLRRLSGAVIHGRYERGIAVSPAAAKFARAAWSRPLPVIPNGVSTSLFHPPAAPEAREPGAPLRLLFVGRWRDPRKGLRYLLEAFERLRARGVPVALDVVGEGTGRPVPEIPGVRFHGIVATDEELAERYRRCDLFVSPATGQESFGVILLEAMASGRPIVCSDIDGYRPVVSREGTIRVPPRDPGALADAIAALAADPDRRARMAAANLAHVEPYSWACLAPRVRKEYLAAIAEKRGEAAAAAHALPEPGADCVPGGSPL
jgi:phosphatidyl-myo-inositol alpha-mannosyltransferase